MVGAQSRADAALADARPPHLCKAEAGGHAKEESAFCTGCQQPIAQQLSAQITHTTGLDASCTHAPHAVQGCLQAYAD